MVSSIESLKDQACRSIDELAEKIVTVSKEIWENPELGLQEFKASALLCDVLDQSGLPVDRGIAGLPTAFRAEFEGTAPGPRVAILAEYDALPGMGHACGHNIIASSALGATLALNLLRDQLPGSVRLLGTPAEESAVEGAGGKVPILRGGHLGDVDAAIMVHPGARTTAARRPSLAARALKIEFFGKAAHAASSPHMGLNALDAVIQTFNSINALRQQVRPDARIHGVITHGGETPNIIPPYTAARIRVRARDAVYLQDLYARVLACAEGAALATGTRLEWTEDVHPYHNTVPNDVISGLIDDNLRSLGLQVDAIDPTDGTGSTDFGNVSQSVPSSFAYLGIVPKGTPGHSIEIREAAGSRVGSEAAINGAKLLAMTAIDLLLSPALVAEARSEFEGAEKLVEA
ncbi:MAG: M20 family metallopeptidase [Dehalococcoidia bacterium]